MSLLVLQHTKTETSSLLGVALAQYGHRIQTVNLFAGEALPADLDEVTGIISLGGPMNVEDAPKIPWIDQELALIKQAHQAGKPILGICLGAQLIATALGGKVAAMAAGPEVGFAPLQLSFMGVNDPMYTGIRSKGLTFHLHGQEVTALPPGGVPLASTSACKIQAFKVGFTTYAFQYHFEWSQADLTTFAQDELVTKAGSSASAITAQFAEKYPEYRRLGDRLCTNLASFLFPINKKG